jgi:hypothetical protein
VQGALEQGTNSGLLEDVDAIVAANRIRAQSDAYSGVAELEYGGYAMAELSVSDRAVGHATTRGGNEFDVLLVDVDAVDEERR